MSVFFGENAKIGEMPIRVDTDGNISFAGLVSLGLIDAFGRQRVSQPTTLYDTKQIADTRALFWDDQAVSGAGTSTTYNTNKASTTMGVSATTAGHRARQTFRWFNYQPGKSQKATLTAYMHNKQSGNTKRFGLFNTQNGIFAQLTGSGWAVGIRTYTSGAVVDNIYGQSTWNIDRLDGSGGSGNPSGLTLTETGRVILFIDFEWLGLGQVRWGFVLGGRLIYAHAQDHVNLTSTGIVYMSTPNLPLRYEIINDGTGAAGSFTHVCCEISSEGGTQDTGSEYAVDRGSTALVTLNDANIYPLLGVRLKSAYLGTTVFPVDMSIMANSTTDFRWALMLNPTVTGTALSFSDVTNTAIQLATPTNATTVSGGFLLSSGYGRGDANATGALQSSLSNQLSLGSTIAGVSDIMVLAAQRLTGTTETFYASMRLAESG